jgi:hypothetical protein
MSRATSLLRDLEAIGATVEPAGTQLILRAGATAIPASLVRRVREAKSDLIAILTTSDDAGGLQTQELAGPLPPPESRSIEVRVVEWLDQHPSPSPEGACAWCGKRQSPNAMVVPFGSEPGTHTWLHAECWHAWHQARRADAICALQADRDFR